MSKRHPRGNVSGRTPVGTKVWNELDESVKLEALGKLEKYMGADWMSVCQQLDNEMAQLKVAERQAAFEAQQKGKR